MKQKKYKYEDLPSPGEVFHFKLQNGLYGACRIIRRNTPEELKHDGAPMVLVATSTFIGQTIPDSMNKKIKEILILTHQSHNGSEDICWVLEPPPKEYVKFALIESINSELHKECYSYGGWSSSLQANLQWHWDNGSNEEELKEIINSIIEEQEEVNTEPQTIKELLDRAKLLEWEDCIPENALVKVRELLQKTMEEIFTIKPTPKNRKGRKIIKECVHNLNTLNMEYNDFICTTEREDLCEILCNLLEFLGVESPEEVIEENRNW